MAHHSGAANGGKALVAARDETRYFATEWTEPPLFTFARMNDHARTRLMASIVELPVVGVASDRAEYGVRLVPLFQGTADELVDFVCQWIVAEEKENRAEFKDSDIQWEYVVRRTIICPDALDVLVRIFHPGFADGDMGGSFHGRVVQRNGAQRFICLNPE